MKINEHQWKYKENHENLWKSMKSMNMHGTYLFWKKKKGCILYSKNVNASHICPPKRNKLFKQRKWKSRFSGNMDLDLQNACQSDIFDENLKWCHGHYGHFAPAGLTGNPGRNSVFDKSVESDFFKSLGLSLRQYSIIWRNSCGDFDVNSIRTRLAWSREHRIQQIMNLY